MATIADIRKRFPQYEEIEDEELLKGVHRKYYSKMDYDDFRGRFEDVDPEAVDERSIAERAVDSAENIAKSGAAEVLSIGQGLTKFGQGATQSMYQAGEYVGLLDEGATQKLTDNYVARNKAWDKELANFLNVDEDSDVMTIMKGAEFIGEAAPLLAVPGSSAAASLPARVATETAVGGALGHAMLQEDLDDKGTSAAIVAGVSAAIPVVGGIVKAGIKSRRATKMDKVAEKTRVYIGEGHRPAQALRRAMFEEQPTVAALEQYGAAGMKTKQIKKAMKEKGEFTPAAVADAMERKALSEGTYIGQLKKFTSESTKPVRLFTSKLLTPITSRFDRLGMPRIANALRRHDMDSHVMIQERLAVKDQLVKATKGLSDKDNRLLKKYLLNGDTDGLARIATPEITAALKGVRGILDKMHKESSDLGANVGFIKDFFPREIRDYKKFAARRGVPFTKVAAKLAEAINKKHKLKGEEAFTKADVSTKTMREYLTDDEVSRVLASKLFKGKAETSADFMTKHGFSRTKEVLNDADLDDYADLGDSLTNYIVGTTTRNQTRKFFGGGKSLKGSDSEVATSGVKAFMNDLVQQGRVLGDDVAEVQDMLLQRFVAGSKAPAKAVQGTKNILYATTLGNPLSAMTQLADMGAAAYLNGFSNAIPALVKTLTRGKGRVTLDDMGLDTLAHELEHVGKTAKFLQKSLKFGQFARVDKWGKETILNATRSKLGKMAATPAGRRKLVNKYREMYTQPQMTKLFKDLQAGNKSEEVKMALWTELTKVQPISLSEMPQYYLQHPNGRMMYMLKTFTIKQLDLVRREAFDQIARGEVAKGTANLARLGAIIGTANGGVEKAKSYITGKDVDFSDAFFANILRNYALSEWTLDKAKQGKPIEAAVDMIKPPVQVFEDPIRDMIEGFKKMRTLKDVPVFGKVMWYMMGYGDK